MSVCEGRETGPEGLVSALVEKGVLGDDWLPAFRAVPRHRFVPDVIWPGRAGMNRQSDRMVRTEDPAAWWAVVHRDVPITTQWDDGAYTGPGRGRTPSSSSSMPTMVASMLAALDVEQDSTVLEIGTGTGWNAALLSHRLGSENVVTVEVDARSAGEARRRLAHAGFTPRCVVGDGARGCPEHAPYDRVIATCSIGAVPEAWIEQTRPGGVIVTPWGPTYGGEAVARLTVAGDGTASGPFVGSSAFMRLRAQRKNLPPVPACPDGRAERRTTDLSPDDVGDWIHMFVIGVRVPDLFCRVDPGVEGAYRLWLYDTALTSWASAGFDKGRTAFPVHQSGPRRLWDELETAYRWWEAHGRPGFERFGLTIAEGGRTDVWLDEPTAVLQAATA
ncbi:methyltransferase domain-containing protein [Streptomyces albireticuli]|uniref:Protein-L-isoaspartate O-methyltransferase n=1 Tax=Streptomyces albireticuli TaxID=1940 RepID=A0A2A2D8Y7_9ACTN|nr:protein-L-isoaspartate(D-aspartate) O-methyltransferase [Streptomyces albireticuli]